MVKLFTNLTCEHVVVSLPLPVLETKIFYSNINNKKIPQKMVLDSASFAQVGFNAVLLFVAFFFRGWQVHDLEEVPGLYCMSPGHLEHTDRPDHFWASGGEDGWTLR